MKEVFIIGLDGATPDLVFPWAKEGKLPNLAKLINNGVSGELKSTLPPLTAPAWTSFMTGKNPGKHGLFHFVARPGSNYDYVPVTAKDNNAKTIWSILSEHGKTVGVMQVPMTYPPEKVKGFIVSGLGTPSPDSEFTYPANLREKLLKDFKFKIQSTEIYRKNNEDKFLKDLEYTEQKKAEVTKYLMEHYDWNCFMVVFMMTDIVQHFFWKDMDTKHPKHDSEATRDSAKKYGNAILNCYQKLDAIIGDLLKLVDENTTVIIMSDHGFGPLYKELHLNYWLRSKGLQNYMDSGMAKGKHWLLKKGLSFEGLGEFTAKIKLRGVSKYLPKKIISAIPKRDALSCIDWSKTKVYSFGNLGMIYINLKGREPEGIVEPGLEYDELREYIIKELYELKDPETNKKIVDRIYKREEIYFGPCVDNAPDLLVVTDMIYQEKATFGDFLVSTVGDIEEKDVRMRRSGQHRMNGIFIMKGKNIQKHKEIKNAEIIDLAPTILYLIDVPIPHDMDGKVLESAFESDYLKSNLIQYEEVSGLIQKKDSDYFMSEEDEEKVKERLKALGYIT